MKPFGEFFFNVCFFYFWIIGILTQWIVFAYLCIFSLFIAMHLQTNREYIEQHNNKWINKRVFTENIQFVEEESNYEWY